MQGAGKVSADQRAGLSHLSEASSCVSSRPSFRFMGVLYFMQIAYHAMCLKYNTS